MSIPWNKSEDTWPKRPWDAKTLRRYMDQVWVPSGVRSWGTKEASKSQLAYAIIGLSKLVDGDERKMQTIPLYFWGVESIREMTAAQCSAIIKWVGSYLRNDWTACPEALVEGPAVVQACRVEQGQQQDHKFHWEK